MAPLPDIAWIGIAIVAVAAALAVLNTLGARVRNELEVHAYKLRVATLRSQYKRRLAEGQEEPIEVDVIDDEPLTGAPPQPARAAA